MSIEEQTRQLNQRLANLDCKAIDMVLMGATLGITFAHVYCEEEKENIAEFTQEQINDLVQLFAESMGTAIHRVRQEGNYVT